MIAESENRVLWSAIVVSTLALTGLGFHVGSNPRLFLGGPTDSFVNVTESLSLSHEPEADLSAPLLIVRQPSSSPDLGSSPVHKAQPVQAGVAAIPSVMRENAAYQLPSGPPVSNESSPRDSTALSPVSPAATSPVVLPVKSEASASEPDEAVLARRAYETLRRDELAVLSGLSARVRFAPGGVVFSDKSEAALDAIFDPLFVYAEMDVTVSVVNTETGIEGLDRDLADRRAARIVDYLVGRGLERERFRSEIASAVDAEPLPVGVQRVRVSAVPNR